MGSHVTSPDAIVTNEPNHADRLSFDTQTRGSMSTALDQMAAVKAARRWAEDQWHRLQKMLEHPLSRQARPNPIIHQPRRSDAPPARTNSPLHTSHH